MPPGMSRTEQGRSSRPVDERSRALLDAVVAVASDLTLDGVLGRILTAATTLADAEYVALGVIDPDADSRLRTFLHRGMDQDVVERIGALPTGHGLLGVLIDDPRPVRLADLTAHPRSSGFPAQHPAMTSFLGVPIRVGDRVFGNLYLTGKRGGGDFTDEDEQVVVALAAAAGAAIDNARLHERTERRRAWLSATTTIITSLVSGASTGEALQLVADRAREVAGADVAWVVTKQASGLFLDVVSGAPADMEQLRRLSLRRSLASLVMSSGEPIVVADLQSDQRAVDVSRIEGWPRLGPVVMVPLTAPGGPTGVLCLGWRPGAEEAFREVDPLLPASFAEQASLAIQVADARAARQRLQIFEDRDRIGRDLHDLVIQRLFATGLGLQQAARMAAAHPDLAARLERAVDDLDDTIGDIRRTIFSLGQPPGGKDVEAEVQELVARAASTLKFRPQLRMEGPLRTALGPALTQDLLAVLGEALSNASRHAQATSVEVRVSVGDALEVRVSDNGVGIRPGAVESGLGNLRRRASRYQGTCDVRSAVGGGTTVVWRVPLKVDPG
jgi:signal transduction histidine kinase